jgi:hypothetical protein
MPRRSDVEGPYPISGPFARPRIEAAAQLLRAVAEKSDPPAPPTEFSSDLHFVYAYTSTPERVLVRPEQAVKDGDYRPLSTVWWAIPQSIRKTERFKTLMRKAGLVDYWRTHTWPDLCRPLGPDDFVCD